MLTPSLLFSALLLLAMMTAIGLLSVFPGRRWAKNAVYFCMGFGIMCIFGALGSTTPSTTGGSAILSQRGVMQQLATWTVNTEQKYYAQNNRYTSDINDLIKINPLLAPKERQRVIAQAMKKFNSSPRTKRLTDFTFGLYLDRKPTGMTLSLQDDGAARMSVVLDQGEIVEATCEGLPYCKESDGQWEVTAPAPTTPPTSTPTRLPGSQVPTP
jgi:hypothetical protein